MQTTTKTPTRIRIELSKRVSAPPVTAAQLQHVWNILAQHVRVPAAWRTVSVAVVDDAAMRRLNKLYRQVNDVTDVLSFPYGRDGGEVVLCYPQAKRQARLKQTPLRRELNWLTVHGFLHLLGYDHERPRDAQIMRPLEQKILAYV